MPTFHVSFKTRLLKLLARVGGPRLIYPLLHGTEMGGTADYAAQDAKTAALAGRGAQPRPNARRDVAQAVTGGERWHRTAGGGTLRAAVFGVNDGLVSNLSLIMGFAGASADAKFVLLAGLSGLLAGASSMAAGEYVSMKAQRELLERQIELEAAELAVSPEEEVAELALIYRAKGLNKEEAERLAGRLTEDPNCRARYACTRRAGPGPERNWAIRLSPRSVRFRFRGRRARAGDAVLLRRLDGLVLAEHRAERRRVVQRRRAAVVVHRQGHTVQRTASTPDRSRRRQHHIRVGVVDRRFDGRLVRRFGIANRRDEGFSSLRQHLRARRAVRPLQPPPDAAWLPPGRSQAAGPS